MNTPNQIKELLNKSQFATLMSLKSTKLLSLCDLFSVDKEALGVADRKLALPRNKLGHPIKALEEISFIEFESDVKRVRENRIISVEEERILIRFATYFLKHTPSNVKSRVSRMFDQIRADAEAAEAAEAERS